MKQYQRAALALAVLRLESVSSKNSIYDYSQGCHLNISGDVNNNEIRLFDYNRGAHFGGSFSGNEYNIYDYGHGEHISLGLKSPGKYSGFHYGSSSHYEITIRGNSASFFDYGTGKFYTFS